MSVPNIYEVFNQDRFWYDKGGVPHRISEMTLRYKHNVLRYLGRNAKRWAIAYLWARDEAIYSPLGHEVLDVDYDGNPVLGKMVYNEPSETTQDMLDRELMSDLEQMRSDPVGWIRSKPVVQALIASIESEQEGRDDGQH
jgi:hypothetical protein